MHRILVVDDEKGIRDLYRLELEAAGYAVEVAADSRSALKILGEAKVDLVLLDIKLKGESGLDLLQTLSREHQGLPVLLSSAYSCYKSDFSSWLAEGYVVKSSDMGELKSEVRKILQKHASREK